jgi:hypothetical protein
VCDWYAERSQTDADDESATVEIEDETDDWARKNSSMISSSLSPASSANSTEWDKKTTVATIVQSEVEPDE